MTRRFLAVIAALWLAGLGRDAFDDWVTVTVLPPVAVAQSVEVLDRDGVLLRAYTVADGLWRLGSTARAVDTGYAQMLLAWEDRRFADHAGVDPRAIARAVWQSVQAGRVVSGGSTLTMQVARLLEDGPTGTLPGKLRQMRVALALERRIGKAGVLDLYLTLAPFGGNVEGIRAASLVWFGREPARLTPAQSALLVALPQSPEARRPDRDASAARTARDRVLMRMADLGVIDEGALQAALSDPVPTQRRAFPALAPHLSDRARTLTPDAPQHHLTLDAALQVRMERLAADTLRGMRPDLSIALVVADHRSGAMLASVGSAAFTDARGGYVDMTAAPRSPGSTLKPLIYAMAFDQGLAHPDTIIPDRPIAFGRYAPQNFDRQFRGDVRVADALRLSLNIPVVMLTEALGPPALMAALQRSGAQPRLQGRAGLAVALGGAGLTLEELVQLYAGLAQGGLAQPLHWRGAAEERQRITGAAAAWHVGHILSALPPPPGAPPLHIAWKTGTSYGHRDAWAIGFDGAHVVGVWLGRPDGTPVPGAFGADLAAPVLFQAFQQLGAVTPLPPPPPDTLMPGTTLPPPLQRFRPRDALFAAPVDAPELAFPPDGARLTLDQGALALKLRAGVPPFTVLGNGAPLLTGVTRREIWVEGLAPGFMALSVIDAKGRAARADLRLD
jgi:penicillin-binding protein 1C